MIIKKPPHNHSAGAIERTVSLKDKQQYPFFGRDVVAFVVNTTIQCQHYMECCVVSGFRSNVHKICALLGYYAAYSVNSLPTFRDNLSVTSSRIKPNIEHGNDRFIRILVRNCHCTLRNIPEERISRTKQSCHSGESSGS
jgi:hypothetical protein